MMSPFALMPTLEPPADSTAKGVRSHQDVGPAERRVGGGYLGAPIAICQNPGIASLCLR